VIPIADPALELQAWVRDRLTESAVLSAELGDRVYDRPPPKQAMAFPWIQFSGHQTVDDGAECMEEASECYLDLHIWSRDGGHEQAARIAAAIKARLHKPSADFDLSPAWRAVDVTVESIRNAGSADGVTVHLVLTVRALVQPI
jgi:hypothetical protein